METNFWKPSVTSQFAVCPVPYHLDTYHGCIYDCSYCFARDFVTFHRRNSDKGFTYLIGNDPARFKKWIERTLAKDYDYTHSEEVAFKERIPLKIGATSDPFPLIERTEKITYNALKALHEIDYPVQIQTKNPELLLEDHFRDLDNANHVIAVTIITTDEKFAKVCEPKAISVERRLQAIKKLTDLGKKVIIKVQPAIYPKILDDLPDMVKKFKDSGAFAFNIEGLKCRVTMPPSEKKIFQKIGDFLEIPDLKTWFKIEGHRTTSDYEISIKHKSEYISLAKKLADEHGIEFYVADNCCYESSCGAECCGTKVLHDYKLWGNNWRSNKFPTDNYSKELGKCFVKFTRNLKNKDNTLNLVMFENYKDQFFREIAHLRSRSA
jgi:DNA repair photolyase